MTWLDSVKARLTAAAPGPWNLCHHLRSIEHDKSCPCGYRGSISAPPGHAVCEMGSTVVSGEEGLELPRFERPQEIANAALIAFAPTDLAKAIRIIECYERALSVSCMTPTICQLSGLCRFCAARSEAERIKGE